MFRSSASSFLPLTCVVLNLLMLLQFTSSLPTPQKSTSPRLFCKHDQSDLLLNFKITINHDVSNSMCYTAGANLDSWKEGTDCCSWEGVTCDKFSGEVVELDLTCSGINGSIQSNNSLFHLLHLQFLNLAHNYFPVFHIPSNFGEKLKYLNLSESIAPGGFIPPELANLLKLETLEISGYSYDLPLEINNFSNLLQQLTRLQVLILNYVNIEGNMLKGITNLSNLTHLDLSNCDLKGGFPTSLGNLSKLSYLDLSFNNLTGYIPSKTNGFQALSTMNLEYNSLEGPIPSWVFNRSSLQVLKIRSNLLVGTLPSNNITWPRKLMILDLHSNWITGTIPSALFALPSLVSFSLAYNNLTGYVGEFQSLMLQEIDLSGNSLQGGNFSSISKLVNLKELDLSYNNLAGTFDLDVFTNLQNLEHVYLSHNIFLSLNSRNNTAYSPLYNLISLDMTNCNANVIPFFIRNLVGMGRLQLSQNNIHGVLPEWLHNTSITWFQLSENSITGDIKNLPLASLSVLDLSHNLIESGLQYLHQITVDTEVNLSFNKLSGALPANISVRSLNLSHNLFQSGLENIHWEGLDDIDLSFNKLGGAIPGNISLANLYLSHNLFESGVENISTISAQTVDLSFNKLSGAIPARINALSLDLSHNSLESGVENLALSYAYTLDLSFNKLVGEVKGNISFISLNLSHNNLTGAENIYVTGMYSLDLSFNNLGGSLPIPSGDNEIAVYLISNNKLSGKIHPNICNLGDLWLMDLSYNNLSGEIPDCMLKMPSLRRINLRSNSLSGIIPQTISANLSEIDMSNNQLQGIIPPSLANCRFLEILDLSNNVIYDKFPTWLEDMQSLKILILGSNKLYGILPSPKSLAINVSTGFTQLRVIDVANNNLQGNLPSHYFQSWTSMMEDGGDEAYSFNEDNSKFYYVNSVKIVNKGQEMEFTTLLTFIKAIDFSNNKFEGAIPEAIGNLRSLVVLNVSGNHFSGEIPSSLGKMVKLNSLDLSSNKLSGRIPGTLSSLTFLGAFNVSENDLQGPIPQGGQLTTFSDDSFKGNPDLCGLPLSTKCGEQPVQNSPTVFGALEEEDEISLVDGFTWESVAIGYGCGFILGILGGVLILKRYQEFVLGIFNIRLHWRTKRTHRQRLIVSY